MRVRTLLIALALAVLILPVALDADVDRNWEKLGEKTVERRAEKDEIVVTAREGRFTAIKLKDLDGGETSVPGDVLLPFYGLSMNLGPIAEWGLALEEDRITVDPATCETSVPGVYAIGDIATYENKLKLILCGFSEAAMAAHAIRARVYPDEELHWEYSTTKGLPDQDKTA